MNRQPFIDVKNLHYQRENYRDCRREKRGDGVDGIVADKANTRDELCGCAAVLALLCQRSAHATTEFRLQDRAKKTVEKDAEDRDGGCDNHLGGRNQAKCKRDKWDNCRKDHGRQSANERYAAADSLLAFSEFKEVKR